MNETPPAAVPESQPETTARSSVWARMVNVFAAPGEVFAEVKAGPPCAANWLAPVLLFIVVGWLGAWLTLSQESIKHQSSDIQERALQKQVESGKITKEQADQGRDAMEKFGMIQKVIGGAVGPVFAGFATLFWWAFLVWLLGAVILKRTFTFMQATEVVGLASMIGALGGVVKTLLVVIMGSMFAGANLAMLVKEFDPLNTWHGVLAMVDLFALWAVALRAVGLAKLSGISTARSLALLFGLWVAGNGLLVGFGLLIRRLFGM